MSDGLYRAFGLTIRSSRPLPGLPRGDGNATRTVRVHVAERSLPELAAPSTPPLWAGGVEHLWRTEDGGRLLRYHDGAGPDAWTMRISPGGDSIDVEHTPGLPSEDVLQVVVNAGLATSLQLSGVPLLHGCAVEIRGRAVVVLGPSGAGKSTLAAALVAAGHALLSDDVAAVESGPEPVVQPGAPRLRMAPASARAVGWDVAGLPRVFVTEVMGDKLGVDLPVAGLPFCAEPRPLAAIYVLAPLGAVALGSPPELEPLPAAEVLSELLANSYRIHALDRGQRDRLVADLLKMAQAVRVRRVRAAEDLGGLVRLAGALVADATAAP